MATRKKKPEESLRTFMQALLVLSKDCNFSDVTAEEYENEMVRHAFISGLSSHDIRQRLLENNELSLDRAFDIVNFLNMTIEHSTGDFPLENVSVAAINSSDDISPETMNFGTSDTDASPSTCSAVSKTKCYFYGKDYDIRNRCPARDAVCHSCGKKGHFSRVCRSRRVTAPKLVSQSSAVSLTSSPSLCMMSAACPRSLLKASLPVMLNGKTLTALVESGSSDSYISSSVSTKLNLNVYPPSHEVKMASSSVRVKSVGFCMVDITIRDTGYASARPNVLETL